MYRLQYSNGAPDAHWLDVGEPVRSCKWALEMLRHIERTERRGLAWRVVDSNGDAIVTVIPGARGAA